MTWDFGCRNVHQPCLLCLLLHRQFVRKGVELMQCIINSSSLVRLCPQPSFLWTLPNLLRDMNYILSTALNETAFFEHFCGAAIFFKQCEILQFHIPYKKRQCCEVLNLL